MNSAKPEILEKEMKIALVLDNYKLPNKADHWMKAMKVQPWIEENYNLIKETVGFGITKGTMVCYRYYKLK